MRTLGLGQEMCKIRLEDIVISEVRKALKGYRIVSKRLNSLLNKLPLAKG